MKQTYITIVILVVLVVGALFIFGNSKKAEAPVGENQSQTPAVADNSQTNVADADSETAAVVKEFAVSGKNFSFTPALITVNKGNKVRITFQNTAGFHDFRIDEFGVATKQAQSPATEVLEFTADKVGSFEYYCSVGRHRVMGMKGTLKVTE